MTNLSCIFLGDSNEFLKIDSVLQHYPKINLIKPRKKAKFTLTFKRLYSTFNNGGNLTHVDEAGKANMVDVSSKNITSRTASAKGSIHVGPEITRLIKENNIKKGDVLGVSKLAGILAAKKTSDLIPLCHNIPLNSINVRVTLDEVKNEVMIEATVSCDGKTGVEMEALTAVSVSALTIYDMCKAVSKYMKIHDVHLVRKTGGSSGDHEVEVRVKSYGDVLRKKTVFIGGI